MSQRGRGALLAMHYSGSEDSASSEEEVFLSDDEEQAEAPRKTEENESEEIVESEEDVTVLGIKQEPQSESDQEENKTNQAASDEEVENPPGSPDLAEEDEEQEEESENTKKKKEKERKKQEKEKEEKERKEKEKLKKQKEKEKKENERKEKEKLKKEQEKKAKEKEAKEKEKERLKKEQEKKKNKKILESSDEEMQEEEKEEPNDSGNESENEEMEEESGTEEEQPDNLKVTIEYVQTKPTARVPHIMYFPKGPPPPTSLEAAQKGDEKSDDLLKVKVFHGDERRNGQRVILANTKRMEYVATNFGAGGNDVNRHVIGIFDKGRKKIRFIESSHIFAMEQQIINFEEKVDNKAALMTGQAARASLVETFGSLKSRNQLNKTIRNRITDDNVSDASLKLLADTIQENAGSSLATDEDHIESQNVEENLPPYDPKAASPSGVYRLANILDQTIVPDLLTQAKSLLTASKKSFDLEKLRDPENDIPLSLLDHFAGVDFSSKVGKKKTAGLFYLLNLMKFKRKWNIRFTRLKPFQIAKDTNIPEPILNSLLNTFGTKQTIGRESGKYIISTNQHIKILNYIFVIHLILSDFHMRLTQLMRDLSLDFKRTRMHAMKIGCVVEGGAKMRFGKQAPSVEEDDITEMTAKLTTPFTLPEFTQRAKKKKQDV